jgi:hypothetical protein
MLDSLFRATGIFWTSQHTEKVMGDKTTVAPMDPKQKNSPVSGPIEGEATVMLDAASTRCFWNGHEFSEGAMVQCDGKTYECTYGRWVQAD